MRLTDTINGMTSKDYKERMKAEHQQLQIRKHRLELRAAKMVAMDIKDDSDSYNVPLALMDTQLEAMEAYAKALMIRAAFEHIDLEGED